MAGRYNMEAKAFADTLRGTVVPKNATDAEFAAFLMVAREYNLNPITKEIFAFPKQGGGIQPIVSVDGWANLINSHPQCDGVEFVDSLNDKGELVSITCQIFRKDRSRPTTATEYMGECRRKTSTWDQWPRRMLRHKALIQAARYAFGFAGIIDQDEAERLAPEPARLSPPPAPPPSPAAQATVLASFAAPVDEYGDWLADVTAELADCESTNAVEALRERVLPELRDDDVEPWKAACAARSTDLFDGARA
jgi:phage recombination protein Bet